MLPGADAIASHCSTCIAPVAFGSGGYFCSLLKRKAMKPDLTAHRTALQIKENFCEEL